MAHYGKAHGDKRVSWGVSSLAPVPVAAESCRGILGYAYSDLAYPLTIYATPSMRNAVPAKRTDILHAFIVHRVAVGEDRCRATLLTKEQGRTVLFFKQRQPEYGRQLQVRRFRQAVDRYAGDFRYIAPLYAQSPAAKYFLLYLNELVFYLAPVDVALEPLYAGYMKALIKLNSATDLQLALREFEWELLLALGSAIDFASDADNRPIEAAERYDFIAGTGFAANPQGQCPGTLILAAGSLERDTKGALGLARLCLGAQIDFLLQGRPLKSRDWLRPLLA